MTDTSTHTPGPWFREHPSEVIEMRGGVAVVIASINPLAAMTDEQEEIAARLIAAAPAMLEALKAAYNDGVALGGPLRTRVRAAIDLATGEGQ